MGIQDWIPKKFEKHVETLWNAVPSWAQLANAQDLAADDFRIFDSRFDHQSRMRSTRLVNRFSRLKKQAVFFVKIISGHFC